MPLVRSIEDWQELLRRSNGKTYGSRYSLSDPPYDRCHDSLGRITTRASARATACKATASKESASRNSGQLTATNKNSRIPAIRYPAIFSSGSLLLAIGGNGDPAIRHFLDSPRLENGQQSRISLARCHQFPCAAASKLRRRQKTQCGHIDSLC